MPYSQHPPDFVFPDNDEGRWEAVKMGAQEGIRVGRCDDFKRDYDSNETDYTPALKQACRNRQYWGDPSFNWCMRCPAGYLVWKHSAESLQDTSVKV